MNAQSDVFESQVILHWRELNEDVLSLWYFKGINILILWPDLVFSACYMDDLLDVQAFD